MALQDRIMNRSIDEGGISIHTFTAGFSLWVRGKIVGSVLSNAFNLTSEELIQINNLKNVYDSLSLAGKLEFILNLEHAGILYEQNYITKEQYKTILGL